MNRYQRCLSRSLIFFTSIMIIFLLIIETNSGFQWIFRITNYFLIGLKTEKISGNWRDFTLHNVNFNLIDLSITASSMRCVINMQSFLNFFHIIKEIDTKNLIITVHQNKSIILNKIKKNSHIQKHIFFIRHFIIEKIKIDQLLLKMKSEDILCFHISSGIKIDTDHITFLPTYISNMNIFFKRYNIVISKKKIIDSTSLNTICTQKILNFSPELIKKIFSIKIDIDILKCKHLQCLYNKKMLNFSEIVLKTDIKNNIIRIKKMRANFNSLMINLNGMVVLKKNSSFFYSIKNRFFIKNVHNKPLIIRVTGTLDDKYSCDIKFNDLFKIHAEGTILLNDFNYSFYIQCDTSDIHFPLYKKTLFNVDMLHFILKGNLDHFYFSINNVFHINSTSSMYSDIQGHADIKNIFIDKMNIFRVKKNIFYEKSNVTPMKILKKNPSFQIDNNFLYKSKWAGHINILGIEDKNSHNFFMPNIDIQGSIMEKKISIFGSLYYKHFSFFKTSGINFFLGQNKIFLKGSLGSKCNFYSFFNANHLDYFVPNLQGIITGTSRLSGMLFSPMLNLQILGKNLQWNDIYLKRIKIVSKNNQPLSAVNYMFTDIKKFSCSLFKIDSLYIKSELKKDKKQNFYFLFKNKKIYMNIIFDSIIDKTGKWYGTFKKIHINTLLGNWFFLNSPVFHYTPNINIDQNATIQIKNVLSSVFSPVNRKILQLFNTKLLNIQYQLSFDTELKWFLGHFLYNGHFLLVSKNVLLEKKIKKNNIINKIKSLKLHSTFQNDSITVNWFLECLNNRLQSSLLSGAIHIKKIGKIQKIDGYCRIFRFPCAIIKHFFLNHPDIQEGTIVGSILFGGDLCHPRVISDINVYNIIIKSNNLFKYMSFCLDSFFKNIKYIKINQLVCIKKGHIFFILNSHLNNIHTEWNFIFHSQDMTISLFPYISFQFFPHIELRYALSQYDLLGTIKFLLFDFKINEKNIIF